MMSKVVRHAPGARRRLNRPKVIGRPVATVRSHSPSEYLRAFSLSAPVGSPATSTTPAPIAFTSVSNSRHVATRLATGLSSDVW